MTKDRQPEVTFTVSRRLRDRSFSMWDAYPSVEGCMLLDMGDTKVSIGPCPEAIRLKNKMNEAKRKACGRFRLVLEFPVKDIRIMGSSER